MMKKYFIIVFALFFMTNISSAQFFNKFSLFGGPMIGWQVPQVNVLNDEMVKIGVPKFSTGGYLTLGGGGYIDIPLVQGLRVGAFGTGFTEDKNSTPATLYEPIYSAKFSLHYAAVSIEYTQKLSKEVDYTIGGSIGVGSTKLSLSKFKQTMSEWDASTDSLFTNYSSNPYSTLTYTVSPQIGIGYNVTKYMYLKLNAGYMFTVHSDWKLEDVLDVKNVPAGIKADGFNFNLGIYFGIFTD
jgi:hypothetical protein